MKKQTELLPADQPNDIGQAPLLTSPSPSVETVDDAVVVDAVAVDGSSVKSKSGVGSADATACQNTDMKGIELLSIVTFSISSSFISRYWLQQDINCQTASIKPSSPLCSVYSYIHVCRHTYMCLCVNLYIYMHIFVSTRLHKCSL